MKCAVAFRDVYKKCAGTFCRCLQNLCRPDVHKMRKDISQCVWGNSLHNRPRIQNFGAKVDLHRPSLVREMSFAHHSNATTALSTK
jgi:hypothetical protein